MPTPPMRLLCVSDTHDRLPPALPETGALAWLHAGDVYEAPSSFEPLPTVPGWQDPDHPDLGAWARGRSIPVYAVRGNHDTADPSGFFGAAYDITGRVVQFSPGILLAGVGWAQDESGGPPLDPELAEICERVQRQVERRIRTGDRLVLLSHYPPKLPGLFPGDDAPNAMTYQSVAGLIAALKPVVAIVGHMHEWAGLSGRYHHRGGGATLIVNPGPGGMTLSVGTAGARVVRRRGE